MVLAVKHHNPREAPLASASHAEEKDGMARRWWNAPIGVAVRLTRFLTPCPRSVKRSWPAHGDALSPIAVDGRDQIGFH
jgi:hypothetical protein